MMKTVTVRTLRGAKAELEDIGLDEAREIFGDAEEMYGFVTVDCSAAAARAKLRDAGYRTRAAECRLR
jgi:hypothetical protein